MTATATATSSVVRRNIVVPALPTIDKYWATLRVLFDKEVSGTKFEFEFCDKNFPNDADKKTWDGDKPDSAILVDVGDGKYHKGYYSASEMRLDLSGTTRSHIWNRGLPLINLNNHTGFLKNLPFAIPAMVREFPHIYSDRERGERETFVEGLAAMRTMFRPMNVRAWTELTTNSEFAELLEIWNEFKVEDVHNIQLPSNLYAQLEQNVMEMNDHYKVGLKVNDVLAMVPWFTLPGYFYRLFVAGESVSKIKSIMRAWLKRLDIVQSRNASAMTELYVPLTVALDPNNSEGRTIGIIEVNDYFEGKAVSKQFLSNRRDPVAVMIIGMPTGGCVIKTSSRFRLNLDAVYAVLNAQEPGRWFYEPRFVNGKAPMLMNQSWQYTGVTPTSFTGQELVQLLQEKVTNAR